MKHTHKRQRKSLISLPCNIKLKKKQCVMRYLNQYGLTKLDLEVKLKLMLVK